MQKFLFVLVGGIILFPFLGYAYETQTHEGLTAEAVDFFNVSSSFKLTSYERELMMQGSVEEDEPSLRVLNHFYDPVRNIGLNDGHSAKKWATSKTLQEYSMAGGGNYSWPTIINDYATGDEERAFRGLGHILHLLEDMATPDHTRNDSHLNVKILGFTIDLSTNPSPYEGWATQKTKETLHNLGENLFAPGVEIYTFSNLGEAFDVMARYANGNFFSKDTIIGDKYSNFAYENPKISEFDARYGYGLDTIYRNKHKLILIKKDEGIVKKVLVDENDFSIFEGYFDRLSRQVVIVGSGIIDLFFLEAEAARSKYIRAEARRQEEEMRKNQELYNRLNSANILERFALGFQYTFIDPVTSSAKSTAQWTGKGVATLFYKRIQFEKSATAFMGFTKNLLANLASTFARETIDTTKETIRERKTYMQERITNIVSQITVTVSANQQIGNRNIDSNTSLHNLEEQIVRLRTDIERVRLERELEESRETQQVQGSLIAWAPTPSPTPIKSPLVLTNNLNIQSSPEPVPNRAPEPLPNRAPEPVPNRAPEPTQTPAPESEEHHEASSSPSDDISENVSENITESSSGPSPTITPRDSDDPTLSPEPDVSPDPVSSEEETEDSESEDTEPTPETEISDTPTPTPEPSSEPSPSESPSPVPESTPVSKEFFPQDVVINEIAWMGTRSSNPNDEWIELFNTTDEEVDLTGWVIESPQGSLTIEFTGEYRTSVGSAPWTNAHLSIIPPHGYFLIERTDDTATSEPAHWFFKGNLPNVNSKKPLEERKKQEGLVLTYRDQEIDVVDLWYAGTIEDGYRTMERIFWSREGNSSDHWGDNDGAIINGMSAGDGDNPPTPIMGTPGRENSVVEGPVQV